MFSSFSVSGHKMKANTSSSTPNPAPRSRRRPVAVACENCRKDRTKCDLQTPCRHCKHKRLDCIRLDGADVPALIQQIQHLVGKVQNLEGRVQQTESSPKEQPQLISERVDRPGTSSGSTSILTPSSGSVPNTKAHVTPPPLDMTLPLLDLSAKRFAATVDALYKSKPFYTQTCVPITFTLDSTLQQHGQCTSIILSRNLQDYYIRLYWQRIHRTLPVIEKTTFETHYKSLWENTQGDQTRLSSHVVDIVLALALQLECNSKPQEPRLNISGSQQESDHYEKLRHTGREYYDACAASLNREHDSPTLTVLQCYILMVMYLRNEQRHNSAYQILGFAIRAANILALHQRPRSDIIHQELFVQDQITDFLFCFDVQQYLELGLPYGVPDPIPKRHIPIGGPEARCFWSYYSELLSITKNVHSNFRSHGHMLENEVSPISDNLLQIDSAIPQFISNVGSWVEKVPPKFQFKRECSASPFCTEAPVEIDDDQPLWKLRQCLLLELSHHWVLMGILRWFIVPDCDQAAQNTVLDNVSYVEYADRAVKHSIMIIEVIHHAYSETEAIPGWQDPHIIQWDATLTLIRLILCRPGSLFTTKALVALGKSESIFSALGSKFTTVAATIIHEVIMKYESQTEKPASNQMVFPGTATIGSPIMSDFSARAFDFPGDFLADDPLSQFDFPMDLDLVGLQMPEPTRSPIA